MLNRCLTAVFIFRAIFFWWPRNSARPVWPPCCCRLAVRWLLRQPAAASRSIPAYSPRTVGVLGKDLSIPGVCTPGNTQVVVRFYFHLGGMNSEEGRGGDTRSVKSGPHGKCKLLRRNLLIRSVWTRGLFTARNSANLQSGQWQTRS